MSTVLLTGATSGLGRFVAFEPARAGHVVLVHGRDTRRIERLVAELTAEGGEAHGFVADLASLERVRPLGDEVAAAHPELDVLINNAGVGSGPPGSAREVSADGHELRRRIPAVPNRSRLLYVNSTRALSPAPPAPARPARPLRTYARG